MGKTDSFTDRQNEILKNLAGKILQGSFFKFKPNCEPNENSKAPCFCKQGTFASMHFRFLILFFPVKDCHGYNTDYGKNADEYTSAYENKIGFARSRRILFPV